MYREEDVECAVPGRRFVASHAVILVPPGQEVRTRWKAGRLRTVSCCFRPEMLADSPELLPFLSQIDSDHQFNIGSPFLRAGLTRIADDSLAPGLDRDLMVRSLLYPMCDQVRHAKLGNAATEAADSAQSPAHMPAVQEVPQN